MDFQTSTEFFSDLNSLGTEMSSINEIADGLVAKGKARISAPAKKVGRKDLKTKSMVNRQKKSKNIAEDDASQTTADVNINREQNKNRKRKATTVLLPEDNVQEEAEEDNANAYEAEKAADSEENKIGAGENPKRKSARKEKSENVSKQYMKGNSSIMGETATDVKVTKKESAKNSTGKATVHPSIREMVLDSFRALRKRNGTSVEEISNYIEGNFQVNINRIKPHIKKFLQKGVAEGLFDRVNGNRDDGKFKAKKTTEGKDKTGKSKKAKVVKKKEVKKVAARTKNQEAGKVSRKIKNDKMRPRKRVGA